MLLEVAGMAKKRRVAEMKRHETLRQLERERDAHLEKRKNRKRLRQDEAAGAAEGMNDDAPNVRRTGDAPASDAAAKKRRVEDAPAPVPLSAVALALHSGASPDAPAEAPLAGFGAKKKQDKAPRKY